MKAHRDIKPANIFCTEAGYKIGDFGIARRNRVNVREETRSLLAGAGTPGYMAPEQILAPSTVDWRADLFSLAAVLHETLTGKRLFRGVRVEFDPQDDPDAARDILEAAYKRRAPLRDLVRGIPAGVADAIDKGLEFDRVKRHASWTEFTTALRRA